MFSQVKQPSILPRHLTHEASLGSPRASLHQNIHIFIDLWKLIDFNEIVSFSRNIAEQSIRNEDMFAARGIKIYIYE